MSISRQSLDSTGTTWWDALGLRFAGSGLTTEHAFVATHAAEQVLRDHPPVAFSGGGSGATITAAQLAELITQAVAQVTRERETARVTDADARRVRGSAKVEEALGAPGSAALIETGDWAGFTQGEAIAWSWSLLQYEPRGITHPGSQLRAEEIQRLHTGIPVQAFGYAKRARELADRGLTVREYRAHRDALGAKIYPRDARL